MINGKAIIRDSCIFSCRLSGVPAGVLLCQAGGVRSQLNGKNKKDFILVVIYVVGCRLSVVGCRLSVVGCRLSELLAIGCWPLPDTIYSVQLCVSLL
jgi:hypothetical protein